MSKVQDARKQHFIVRLGLRDQPDEECNLWENIVHGCYLPGNVVRYRVTLHGADRTILVEHFDVHLGRYANDQEETSVLLSAVGHACELSSFIEQKVPWQLSNFIRYCSKPGD